MKPDHDLQRLGVQCQPTQAEARAWLFAAKDALGLNLLAGIGLAPQNVQRWLGGAAMRGIGLRLIWWSWSLTHCPSNLTDLFTWITWGRFNPQMPQDYRQQAIRLLHRKTGPTTAGKAARRVGVAPWARAVTLKKQYLVPSCYAPMLYG